MRPEQKRLQADHWHNTTDVDGKWYGLRYPPYSLDSRTELGSDLLGTATIVRYDDGNKAIVALAAIKPTEPEEPAVSAVYQFLAQRGWISP